MQDIPIKTCLIWDPFSLACGIKGLELLGLALSTRFSQGLDHCSKSLPERKCILHTEY